MRMRATARASVLFLLVACRAFAQCGAGGISLSIDPSVRSAGMGGATTSVFWGDDPNYWANPSLLGYHRGIRYESSDTQLVPDLADDVFFETDRWTVGAWGVGLALATRPADQGRIHLDYGESEATDEFGNVVGTFNSFEDVESWGLGVNVLEFFESLVGPKAGSWSRYGDVSLGLNKKRVHVDLVPPGILPDPAGIAAAAETDDIGILLRATPYNTIDHPSGQLGLRIDVTWGRSISNFKDAELVFLDSDQADPLARDTRWGLGFRVAAGVPHAWRESLREGWTDWLVDVVTPIVSVGTAWGFSTISTPDPRGDDHRDCNEIHRWGVEATFLNIFTLRRGSIDDREGDVNDSSWGWSLGFRLHDLGGFRIDHATVPQATGLSDVDRDGFMAWVDVIAIGREIRKL